MAFSQGLGSWLVLVLACLTTLFLQVLSNLSNDYGDTVKGVDNNNRKGPQRTVQSGKISLQKMKHAMYAFGFLSLISGLSLIILALGKDTRSLLLFFLLGLAAIAAAVKYTVGQKPYGYHGLGDVFVFVFFGFVGVGGTYFLHAGAFNTIIILPSVCIGLFSASVLNMNNLRDIINDQACGKITLAVRLGREKTKWYQFALVGSALAASILHTVLFYRTAFQWGFLLILPLLFLHLRTLFTYRDDKELDKELKRLALTTFAFCLTFGTGLMLQ